MPLEQSGADTVYTFTVARSANLTGTATVNWAVTGTSANPLNADDFQGGVIPSGVLTFNPGVPTQTIAVTILGDSIIEADEQFTLVISNPSTGSVANPVIVVTVTNDDTLISIPLVSGETIVGRTLWIDVGLDTPETTYTIQWVSGTTKFNLTPINGATGEALTVPNNIGGQYVAAVVTPANGQPARYSDIVRIHYATMTAPVVLRTSASGTSPFTYTVTYDNTVFADDIERVQISSDANFGAAQILWDATRGLTEAAFSAPFTSDDSVDADPAWSMIKPTLTGTYFIRRRVESLDGLLISQWSNTESNFILDLTVRINATQTSDSFTITNNNLTFANDGNYRSRGGRVNYSRQGRFTFDMEVLIAPPTGSYQVISMGVDDGALDWNPTNVEIGSPGYRGAMVTCADAGAGLVVSTPQSSYNNVGFTSDYYNNNGGCVAGDILRVDYTPGTFTVTPANGEIAAFETPNDNGIIRFSRIRSGVEVLIGNFNQVPSMKRAFATFGSQFNNSGTLKFDNLTPAIQAGSVEYQDAT